MINFDKYNINIVSDAEYKQWALKYGQKASAVRDKDPDFCILCSSNGKVTTAINIKTGRMGCAWLRPGDTPNVLIGAGVAYARYLKAEEPITMDKFPKVVVGNLKRGDVILSDVLGANVGVVLGKSAVRNDIVVEAYCRAANVSNLCYFKSTRTVRLLYHEELD